MINLSALQQYLFEHGYHLNEEQINQFERYYQLLIEWNQKMNLTAITDPEEVLWKHFIDSVSLVGYFDLSACDSLIDIGTGAGFPGIPLKILYPTLSITLLDSLNKRITFLNEVIKQCGFERIKAIHGRAEDFGHNVDYRESYDVAVSRAVANLSTLTEYCSPFVKVGGHFLPYKSAKTMDEVELAENCMNIMNLKMKQIYRFSLRGEERTIIQYEKMNSLSEKYPRMGGKPLKKPL